MLDLISPSYLLALGILFIVLETVSFSFVSFSLGLGFLVVALLSYFNVYDDGLWQLTNAAVLAVAFVLVLRTKKVKSIFLKNEPKHNDNFLNVEGEGVIKEQKVYFKATFWDIDSRESFEEGEKVKVLGTKKGKATIEKLPAQK